MKRSPVMAAPLHQRALAWLLTLAVLFGQGLGAVHSISHGVPGVGGHAHAQPHAAAHTNADLSAQGQAVVLPLLQAHGPACDHSDAQALFSHAPDEPGCRLYDQLLQAGPLMPVSAVLALPARTRAPPPPVTGVLLAAPSAAYQARGPPGA